MSNYPTEAIYETVTGIGSPWSAAFAAYKAHKWPSVFLDMKRVEEGAQASIIAGSPLWLNGPQAPPSNQQGRLKSFIAGLSSWLNDEPGRDNVRLWQEMKTALLAAGQDWGVWTDWYEDRLYGRVREQERELVYMRIDEELWKQGPAVVNAAIKRWIAELESIPPIEAILEQDPTGTRFGGNPEGPIETIPDPPAHGIASDAAWRESYDEVRIKAGDLAALSPNELGKLKRPINRFCDALKNRIEDISMITLWSCGNTLRCRLTVHNLLPDNAEPEQGRLPPLVAESLRDLVHGWNIFVDGDPEWSKLDKRRLGPEEVEAAKQKVAAAAPIIEALQQSENVATPAAIEAIVEQAEAARTAPPGIDGNQSIGLLLKTRA